MFLLVVRSDEIGDSYGDGDREILHVEQIFILPISNLFLIIILFLLPIILLILNIIMPIMLLIIPFIMPMIIVLVIMPMIMLISIDFIMPKLRLHQLHYNQKL